MNIWDKVWNKDIYSNERVRSSKAKSKLRKYKNMRIDYKKYFEIVDFGSGSGYVIAELVKVNPSIKKVVLIDNSSVGLKKAQKNLNGLKCEKKFIKKDLNIPISQEKMYDFAIAFSILEHLENVNQGIENIYKSLKEKGEVIMIWSNKKSIFYLQHKVYEKLGMWRYGLTKEIAVGQLDELLNNKFIVLSKEIEPCFGDKGIWTFLDKTIHKFFCSYGRYIFLHLQKVE